MSTRSREGLPKLLQRALRTLQPAQLGGWQPGVSSGSAPLGLVSAGMTFTYSVTSPPVSGVSANSTGCGAQPGVFGSASE